MLDTAKNVFNGFKLQQKPKQYIFNVQFVTVTKYIATFVEATQLYYIEIIFSHPFSKTPQACLKFKQ